MTAAGALQGWPLTLGGGELEVCSDVDDGAPVFTDIGRRVGRHRYELPGGARDALAYQAVLDVIEARRRPYPQDDRPPAEKIDAALRHRIPIPM